MAEQEAPGTSKNPSGKHIRSGQRLMVYNLYLKRIEANCKTAAVKLTSQQVGISEKTVWTIVKDIESGGISKSPPKKRKRQTRYDKLDETQKKSIIRHVHSFFLRNELPTCTKVLTVINDDSMPQIKRTTLWKILKKLGFKWEKRGRNNMLTERPEIILWRRRYLTSIRKFRAEGKKKYCDETWVNAGHTTAKVWKDTTVVSARQAFNEGLSTGSRDPSGKGKRLIVLHIGSETGFVDGGLLLFESKKTGDYHDDMNSTVFSNWMQNILPHLAPDSVIVMDNAPYHSVKTEKCPTASWTKSALTEWLMTKGIQVDGKPLKIEILDLAKQYTSTHPINYEIDEMVSKTGRTILRLPPYHCNLNPIELVWAQVKHHVAANNKTYKLADVKTLLLEGVEKISADAWGNCVKHAIAEEQKMYDLDNIVEDMTENLRFNVNTGLSSDSSTTDSDSDCAPLF